MDFLPDENQQAFADATRQYVESRIPLATSTQLDDVRWKEISEMGWLGLGTDADAGGAGGTLLDQVFLFREIGRGLVGGPILTTLAAARTAACAGEQSLAAEMIAGHRRVARALAVPDDPDRLLVLDAEDAELMLLVESDRVVILRLPPNVEFSPGIEDASKVGHIRMAEVGRPVVDHDNSRTVGNIRRTLSILSSAQLAGITCITRDLAVEYAKTRVQFGKPIGAFQAIKHKCADMATRALAADNVTFFAALAEMAAKAESDYEALAAAAYTRRAALANARSNIQIHGAMGFTVESSAHRYLKRAHAICAGDVFPRAGEQLGGLPTTLSEEA